MSFFLEERLSDLIRYGSAWGDSFAVTDTNVAGGDSFQTLLHRYPVRRFNVSYMLDNAELWTELLGTYQRAFGTFGAFRARCFDEWSSNGAKGTPTALDQPTLVLTATTRQMVKQYGTDKAAGPLGYPYRIIRKPVAGTVLAAKNGTPLSGGAFSVDTTTGIITVAGALITDVITAGFQFDFPVRFITELDVTQAYPGFRPVDSVELVEKLNP